MAKVQLAELQLAIMQVLWEAGEATVAHVREALAPERRLAHTTVGTMLSKLEASGYVAHRSDGRVNIYRALLEQEKVSRSMVTDLAQRLFHGNVADLMCHLLDGCQVTSEELARLTQLIQDKERELEHD